MKIYSALFFVFYTCVAAAQGINIPPTKSFSISGDVKEEQTINDVDLKKYKVHIIGDVKITNHKGELKGIAKGLSGVLLKDVLSTVTLNTDNPKVFSEYVFICTAVDGYKVVYSWNELFNSAVGNSVYLVTEKDHKPMEEQEEHLLMISSHDTYTSRRFLKNLKSITVAKAD